MNLLCNKPILFKHIFLLIFLNGYLDVSFNRISEFEVFPSAIYNFYKAVYITVPFGHSWIFASGNRAFSVVNLVKAALNINLNFINQSKLANTPETKMLRLHTLTVLVKTFK